MQFGGEGGQTEGVLVPGHARSATTRRSAVAVADTCNNSVQVLAKGEYKYGLAGRGDPGQFLMPSAVPSRCGTT